MHDNTPSRALARACFAATLVLLVGAAPAPAQSEQKQLRANPAAERWVAQQVAAAKSANLKEKFAKAEDRVITASFLEGLLTKSIEEGKARRRGVNIFNATVLGEVNLPNAKMPYAVSLEQCRFTARVNLVNTNLDGDLSFDGSEFEGSADFEDMQVSGDAFFREVTFKAAVRFLGANVGKNFEATSAQFRDAEAVTFFTDLRVKDNAYFTGAVFEANASFYGMDVGGNLEVDDAQFRDKERAVGFEGARVNGYALFREVVFEGPTSFLNMTVAKTFDVEGAHFRSKEHSVRFDGMKIEGNAFFRNTTFDGPAAFLGTNISGSLEAKGAKFNAARESASFEDLKADTILFTGASFAGQPYFSGMSYRRIDAGSWDKLLDLITQSVYGADVYAGLEAMAYRDGYPDRGKQIYIAQRRRERSEHLSGVSWVGNFLLDVLVGYGRRPWLAFVYGAVIVAFGCFVFRRRGMVLKKPELQKEEQQTERTTEQAPEEKPLKYTPFWYSLDLFLPFVDLQVDSLWVPDQRRRFARHYMYVHTILGWVMIPVGLAALTGIIK